MSTGGPQKQALTCANDAADHCSHKLPPVPNVDGQRWCRACQAMLPVSAFPTGKRRYLCRQHLWLRCTRPCKERRLSDSNHRHVCRLWRRCWEDAKLRFGQEKITLVQKHIAKMLENVRGGNQNVKFTAHVPENADDGNQNVKSAAHVPENADDGSQNVKFAANLDRSCDYVLRNFSDCAAIVPVDPEKVLSPANAAVVDMPGRKVLLQACKWGGRKAYERALARIVK